jgi:CO/xanthine dehydrogenase Mo-binding subunit
MPDFNVVGKRMDAVGSRAVVTGKTVYSPDIDLPHMLVGKLLYSSYPFARILRLDVSKAHAIPGVAAVLTAQDIPGENSYLYWYPDQPLLVEDQVRYQGDAIAAVAAETEEIAQAALDAIEVEYEQLEGIFDPEEAMKPDARRVWPEKPNLHSHHVDEWGDIEKGFSQADMIVENTYRTQYVEHAMLETESAVAYVDEDGMIVVFASAQAPHRDRMQIARALGVPEAHVREITPRIGGAFGAKDEAHIQIHAALLALKTGRPVKMVRSREESIQTHVKRHPTIIRYRTGATKDGVLTAVHMTAIGDTGPYVNAGEEVMMVTTAYGVGPYYVPNARTEAYTVLTNNPTCGAMRGFGVTQGTFAIERQMDELALKLDIDPLEIRSRNGLQTGQQFQPKAILRQGDGMKACLEKAAELSGWESRETLTRTPEAHLRRGWGIATGFHKVGYGPTVSDHSAASISMAPDGSVLLRTGAADMGQGAHTIMVQYAAEILGVEPSVVSVIKPDTSIAADSGASVASRVTAFSGSAVIQAAEPIREVLVTLAAEEMGADQKLIDLRLGSVYVDGERVSLKVEDLSAKAYERDLPMQASGYYAMPYPEAVLPDGSIGYLQTASFGAHIAQVLVDVETGIVTVEEIVAVHDVGQIVNPGGVRGQIEGAVSMAFGYGLLEELVVDQGKIQNTSFESYLIPTTLDTPNIKIGVVEIPEPGAPLGAKPVGEPPTNLAAAAIANAVTDAIDAPIAQLPLTPERVLDALESRDH